MKKNYIIILFAFIAPLLSASAQEYSWQWARAASPGNTSSAFTTTLDNSGNLYTGGSFQSTSLTFGSTTLANTSDNFQMFIVKHNSDGGLLWAVGGTPANYSEVYGVTTDASGNLYAVGRFFSEITFGTFTLNASGFSSFLVKFNSQGVAQWAVKPGGAASTNFLNIAWRDNNIYVCGEFYGSPLTIGSSSLTNLGSGDAFAAKYDNNGNGIWARRIAGTGVDSASSIAVNSFGEVFITGSYSSQTINSGGTPVSNSGNSDIYLTKLGNSGSSQWIKSYGGTGYDSGYKVLVNAQNEAYLLGNIYSATASVGNIQLSSVNGTQILLAKVSDVGNTVWAHLSGGNDGDNATDFKLDAAGNLFITGFTYSSTFAVEGLTLAPQGFSNIFVIKMLPAGTAEWVNFTSGADGTEADAIAVNADEEVYLAGRFNTSLILGTTSLSNPGSNGMFIAKMSPEAMSIDEAKKATTLLYPNPVKDKLHIISNLTFGQGYSIADVTGRIIKNGVLTDNIIYTQSFPAGIYFLKINNTTTKFIKE